MGNVTNTEQWAAMERLRFIERAAWWRGMVRRQDVMEEFGLGPAQVSSDFQKYLELNPGSLVYSLNRKRYEGAPAMTRILDSSTLEEAVTQFIDRAGRLPVTGREERPGSAQVDWLVLPERRPGPEVERRIFQAVLHGMRVEVLYGTPGKGSRWRKLMPHALAWSGHRWHVRAWCLENGDYRDFSLGRMEDARWPEAAEPVALQRDKAWETMLVVEVEPHPELDEERRAAVAAEFRMERRRLKIPVRQAMMQYLETALGLAPAHGEPGPPRLQRVKGK